MVLSNTVLHMRQPRFIDSAGLCVEDYAGGLNVLIRHQFEGYMAKDRKPKRAPGKKRGATIKNSIALIPLNAKDSGKYERSAYAALTALEHGVANMDNLRALWILADLSERIAKDRYAIQHAATVKRLCAMIKADEFTCSDMTLHSLSISTDVLLRWLVTQPNMEIAKAARDTIREIFE